MKPICFFDMDKTLISGNSGVSFMRYSLRRGKTTRWKVLKSMIDYLRYRYDLLNYALCRWDRAGEPDRSTVRCLAVRRPWRKRGIALALLHAAFGGMYRQGKRGAGLGVDATSYTGADRLYVRAGMHRAFETLRYQKVLRDA